MITQGFPLGVLGQGGGGGLKTGLVAWWTFDETSGTRSDSHASNDLTDFATTSYIAGKQSNAAMFVRADDDRIYTNSVGSIPTGDNDWSVAGWVNFTSLPSSGDSMGIVSMADSTYTSNGNIDWRVFYNGTVGDLDAAVIVSSTYYEANPGASISLSTWYFIYAYYDSTANVVGISVNDGTIDTQAVTGTPNSGSDQFKFGRLANNRVHALNGALDEWGLWSRVLTASEVSTIYNSAAGITYTDIP
jgi:hypothetical protein